jgi:ATP-dependent protease Clp ATPase subunit
MPELTAIIKSVGNWFKPSGTSLCSGCERLRENKFIVRGPSVSLCRDCWDDAFVAMKGQKQNVVCVRDSKLSVDRCSFCGHRAPETGVLAAWPKVTICADCLLLCDEILTEQGV